MKNLATIILFAASVLIASAAQALIMDAPHNAGTDIACTDCHNYLDANGGYSDDLCLSCHNNATGGGYTKNSAPKMLTHSSANTSAKYGSWSMQCLDCHWQHNEDQRLKYGVQALFLATGTITSVTDNGNGTTTFGYGGLVEKFAGWGDYAKWNKKSWNASSGNERGLIVYPNTANLNVSFEIADATSTAITVKGSINSAFPGAVAVGSSFGISYGQFINADVVAPDMVSRPVKFFENTSIFSFAFNDATPPSAVDPAPNGICQVCHSQTLHWRNDGTAADHNSGSNCMICHRHEEGFKFNCVSCHESPPATGKHDLHFDSGSVSYGTTDIQSTPLAYSFSCGICHTGTHLNTTANPRTAEVSFSGVATSDGAANAGYTRSTSSIYDPGTGWTFNYSNGACSNVYCHGNYPGSGKNASPTFNTGTAVCGSCHGASNTEPPASGSHIKHASQYNMSCSLCHKGEIGGAGPSSYTVTDKQKHVNGFIDWAFDSADTRISFSSAYNILSGAAAPSNGANRFYGNCSNTYCHDSGISAATLQQPVNVSPRWGASLGCTGCHQYPPAYTNGSPKANSHQAHGSFACKNCHVNTTTTGYSIANTANHVNKIYDVYPDLSSGVTLTYTFASAGGTCTNISCHGGNTATWGTSLTCQNCHLGSANVEDFSGTFYDNGTTSLIAIADWSAAGHGRPAASGTYNSGNVAADFTTTHACQYCHDDTISHKTASNPFRLKNFGDAAWGKNGVCQGCHASDSTGITVDGVFKNGAKKIGSTHYGTKHNTAADGGQFCWDCHNPHGSANLFMIQTAVAATSDVNTGAPLSRVATSFVSFDKGTGYAKSVAPFDGVCNVCHTSTNHYTATSGDGHNADSRCTTCHPHTVQATTDAFKPSCDGCHGTPPTTATYGGTTGLVGKALNDGDTGATNPLSPGAHEKHAVGRSMKCETCHKGSDMYRGVTNGKTIDMGFSIDGSTFPGFMGSAATGTLFGTDSLKSGYSWLATNPGTTIIPVSDYNNTCAVYCHGGGTSDKSALTGGANQAPSWTGGPYQAACGTCHGGSTFDTAAASPPTTGAHVKHAGSENLGLACNKCHANTTDMGHVDGVVSWAVATADSRFGTLATYNSLSTGSTGTLAPSASYGSCSNIYCHSDVQDQTYGFGGPVNYASPQWGNPASVRCGSCHNSDGVQGDKSYMVSGSHAIHVDPDLMKKSCSECHNGYGAGTPQHADGMIQLGFKTDIYGVKGSYSDSPNFPGNGYGSCSNVYCHSLVQGPTGGPLKAGDYKTTTWGSDGLTCNSCHADMSVSPAATGSHRKHSQDYGYGCNLCHNGAGRNTLKHADGIVDVAFGSFNPSGMYSQTTNTPGNGFGSCSNVYCHSDGKGVNAAPTWGGPTPGCNSCHQYPPAYTNGSPKANSHQAHSVFTCNKCHVNTTTNGTTITTAANHANKVYDVYPDLSSGVTLTYTFASTGGTCANISCHGGNTATWGASLTCQNCHLGSANVEDFSGTFYDNGTTSLIATADWSAAGHGRPATSGTYTSGNAAADFTTTHACQYCHDDAISHKTASNPFRLRNITDAVWGKNGVCQNCHADGSAGVTVDNSARNGAKKIGSVHSGARHNSELNGGQFCWDCHNPHGNTNLYMVQTAVAATSDADTGVPLSRVTTSFVSFATGTGYAKSVAPFDGVCNVCHATTNHYTATSGDEHNAGTRCTQCHVHTGKTPTDAFKPSCDACHGNPPVGNTTLDGFVFPSKTGSITAGAHDYHVNAKGVSCDSCHANSVGTGSLHNTGDFKVSIGFSLFNAAYLGGAYDGQTTVRYKASEPNTQVSSSGLKSCSNVYCHGSTLAPDGGVDTSPVWDNAGTAACGTCHGATMNNPPTRGSHKKHTGAVNGYAANRQYGCTVCHNSYAPAHVDGRANWAFDTTTYPWLSGALYNGLASGASLTVAPATYNQCSNLYCHSVVQTATGGPLTGQPGEYKTPQWGSSTTGQCGSCHDENPAGHASAGGVISSGSHAKHVAYPFTTSSASTQCAVCHKLNPSGKLGDCGACHGNEVNKHVNHQIDIAFDAGFVGSAIYNGSPDPGAGFANCSNTYCHSSGVSVRTGVTPANTTTNWGSGVLACNACHGNTAYPAPNDAMPNYTNGSPKENSHQAHVINSGIACANCHYSTTTTDTSIASTTLHVNGKYDAQANGTFGGKTISFVYSAATATQAGSCGAISCHGGNTAKWGATLACQDCHLGTADLDNFSGTFWNNGTTGVVSSSEWNATGHGRTSGNYASGNPPAIFTTLTASNTADNGCQFCHDGSVSHKNSANPFRLKNLSNATWGKNGNCQVCHATGSAGMTVDGVFRNGAKKIGSEHYGVKHTTTADGGQFCWDCHDPHGDGNVFMIHASVAKTSDAATGAPLVSVPASFTAFSTGTDYAGGPNSTKICNTCHTSTSHYTATSSDTHNSTIRCMNCHKHTDEAGTITAGFKPYGDNCYDCHSSAGGPTPGTTPDAYHAKHVKTPYAGKVSTNDYGNYTTNQWYRYSNTGGAPDMGCGYCHPQSSATHMNGSINLYFAPTDTGAANTLKAKNGTTQLYAQSSGTNVTCSSVYCHSDGYLNGSSYGYRATPNWYGGTYTGDKCAGCHGNSPTGSAAHAKHAVGNHYNNIYSGTTGFATAGNTATSSHGNPNTSTTLNCNICHNNTVTTSGNDKNTVCVTCHAGTNLMGSLTIAATSTSHVNGVVDVAFAPVQVKTKAQLRELSITELTLNWQRNNGYKVSGSYDSAKSALSTSTMYNSVSKTCSSVACHNGFTVQWNSTTSCDSCHSALP